MADMKFYFCEGCGVRLTSADLAQGLARDKKLKGVYCRSCANGIMTMETMPLSPEEARQVLETAELTTLCPPGPAPRLASSRRVARPAHRTPEPIRSNPGLPPAVWLGGAAVLGLATVLLLAAIPRGKATPPPPVAPPELRPGSDISSHSAPAQAPLPAGPPKTPQTPKIPPPKSVPVPAPLHTPLLAQGSAPRSTPAKESAEQAARAAYEKLVRFEGLKTEDRAGRRGAVEVFLRNYGSSGYAASARDLLKEEGPRQSGVSGPATPNPLPAPAPAAASVAKPAETPLEPTLGARLAYQEFLSAFWALLGRRDGAGAAALLAKAEADPLLAPLKTGWSETHQALNWLKDLEPALAAGIQQLRDTEHFELGMANGTSLRVGRRGPFQVAGVQAGTIRVTGKGMELQVPIATISPDCRQRLEQLGLGANAKAQLQLGLLKLLRGEEGAERSPSLAAQTILEQARAAGATPEDLAFFKWVGASLDSLAQERAASRAWEELAASKDVGPTAPLRTALEAFQASYGSTLFLAQRARELKAIQDRLQVLQGLLGRWSFDEGKGNEAKDSSGNDHHGILFGDPQWAAGRMGGALALDGKDDYVSIPFHTSFNALPLSVSFWILATKNGYIIARYSWYSWNGFFVNTAGDLLYYASPSNGIRRGGWTLRGEQWYQVVMTVDATDMKLWENGVLKLSGPWGGNPAAPSCTNNLEIGRMNGQYTACLIDDLRLYNRVLSAEEIKTLAKIP